MTNLEQMRRHITEPIAASDELLSHAHLTLSELRALPLGKTDYGRWQLATTHRNLSAPDSAEVEAYLSDGRSGLTERDLGRYRVLAPVPTVELRGNFRQHQHDFEADGEIPANVYVECMLRFNKWDIESYGLISVGTPPVYRTTIVRADPYKLWTLISDQEEDLHGTNMLTHSLLEASLAEYLNEEGDFVLVSDLVYAARRFSPLQRFGGAFYSATHVEGLSLSPNRPGCTKSELRDALRQALGEQWLAWAVLTVMCTDATNRRAAFAELYSIAHELPDFDIGVRYLDAGATMAEIAELHKNGLSIDLMPTFST